MIARSSSLLKEIESTVLNLEARNCIHPCLQLHMRGYGVNLETHMVHR